MRETIKRFVLFQILFLSTVLNIYSEELEKYWDGLPHELFERYGLANEKITEDWVLKFADSLDLKSHELNDMRLRVYASQIRSHYAFAKNDSASYMYHCHKTMDLAKEADLMPFYYTEEIGVVVFFNNNHRRHQALLAVQDILKEAKERNDIQGIYAGYMSMCYYYTSKAEPQHAIEYGLKAAECLDKMGSPSHTTRTHIYNQLAVNYLATKDYTQCIKCIETALKYDDKQPDTYFTLSKAYFELGDFEKFKESANKFMKTKEDDSYVFELEVNIIDVLIQIVDKNYTKALELIEEIEPKDEKLYCLLGLYKTKKDWQNAYMIQTQINEFNDSIELAMYSEDISEMSGELDALYKIKEKDEVLIRQRYYMIIASILIIAIILGSIFFISRYRTVKRKNRALAHNIDKLIKYKQKVLELENEKYGKMPNPTVNDETANYEDDNIADEEIEGSMEELPAKEGDDFTSIERFIYELTSRRLFTDINFNRDSLIDELHIQKRTFTKKFEAYTGNSFKEYITSLRLEYAAQLIKEHPEYTIEAIAMECGIASYVTFHRNFTRHFGIAPSSYRQQ